MILIVPKNYWKCYSLWVKNKWLPYKKYMETIAFNNINDLKIIQELFRR